MRIKKFLFSHHFLLVLLLICSSTKTSPAQVCPGCGGGVTICHASELNAIPPTGGGSVYPGTTVVIDGSTYEQVQTSVSYSCGNGTQSGCSICGSTAIYFGNGAAAPTYIFSGEAYTAESDTSRCTTTHNLYTFTDTYGPIGGTEGAAPDYKMVFGMCATPASGTCPTVATKMPNGQWVFNSAYLTYGSSIFLD